MKLALPYIVLLVFSFLLFMGCSNGKKENISSISNPEARLVSDDLESGEWQFRDLTEMSVGSWEPSYDTELWRRDKSLHLFVQNVSQRDHEQSGELGPQMVYVLEWEPKSGR